MSTNGWTEARKSGGKTDIRELFVPRFYFGCEADNVVRFWGEVNPDFFKGTVVEKQAAEVLAASR